MAQLDPIIQYRLVVDHKEFKRLTLALRGKAKPSDAFENQELAVKLLQQAASAQKQLIEVLEGTSIQAEDELKQLVEKGGVS